MSYVVTLPQTPMIMPIILPTYIKNHIQKAKCLLQLSKLDQENPDLTRNSISGLTKEKSWRNNDGGK